MDKKELYEKVEKALNQAFEFSKQAVKVVSEKAGEAAHITKLLVEKATLEHKIGKHFAKLGSTIYEKAKSGNLSVTLSEPGIKAVIEDIHSLDQLLTTTEKSIREEKKQKS